MRSTLVAAWLLAVSVASADTKIVYVAQGGAGVATVLYVAGDRMRLELPDAESGYVLFDAAAQTLVSVDPDTRTYAPLEPATIGRLTAQLAADQLALGDALESATPEQRAQVERMLGKTAVAVATPVVTRTRERATVGGYDCEVLRYEVAGQRGKVCVAASKSFGLSTSDESTLARFKVLADRMAVQAFPSGASPGVRLVEISGMPAGWKHADLPASVARRVSHDTLPTSLFVVPSDYRREPLPSIR